MKKKGAARVIVPFNKPFMGQKEASAAVKAIRSGNIGGNGPVGRGLEEYIERLFKVKAALLTTSCTHSLELAMMTLDIGHSDEVILPSFSFVSAATAVIRSGARPVFTDIEDDYLNIDPSKIKRAITPKTRAVLCVHYGGVSCDMDEITKICRLNNIYLIEDAAQAVGSRYNGKFLGTIGDIGCFSFHETKNLTCGEGGAFLTNNKNIAGKAGIMREKGTNRSAFLKGEVDKYTWHDIGSSYVLSEILAAVLREQFRKMGTVINKRKRIGLRYLEGLEGLERKNKIILPRFQIQDGFNWHIFYFRVRAEKERERVIKDLKRRGIGATSHFVPLHLSPYAREMYGYKEGDFPVTEKASSALIRLPVYPDLAVDKQMYIIDSLYKILR